MKTNMKEEEVREGNEAGGTEDVTAITSLVNSASNSCSSRNPSLLTSKVQWLQMQEQM